MDTPIPTGRLAEEIRQIYRSDKNRAETLIEADHPVRGLAKLLEGGLTDSVYVGDLPATALGTMTVHEI